MIKNTKMFTMQCTEAEMKLLDELAVVLNRKCRGTALKIFLNEALPRFIRKMRKDDPNYLPWKVTGKGTFLENLTYNDILQIERDQAEAKKRKEAAEYATDVAAIEKVIDEVEQEEIKQAANQEKLVELLPCDDEKKEK